MIALQNICQSNKIPYYFFNSFWSFVDNENKVGGFTWDEFLDKHKYSNLLDITKIDKVCQLKYIEDNYGDFVIDGHPGIKSNKMWAEYLEKQIRSLYE